MSYPVFQVGDIVRTHYTPQYGMVGEVVKVYQGDIVDVVFPGDEDRRHGFHISWLTLSEVGKVKKILANYE